MCEGINNVETSLKQVDGCGHSFFILTDVEIRFYLNWMLSSVSVLCK